MRRLLLWIVHFTESSQILQLHQLHYLSDSRALFDQAYLVKSNLSLVPNSSTNDVELSNHWERSWRVRIRHWLKRIVVIVIIVVLESEEMFLRQAFAGLSSAIIGARPRIMPSTFFSGIFSPKVSTRNVGSKKNACLLIVRLALSYPEGNFVRVKNEMVHYETRKWRILEQILIHQPDLCSLEEMDIYDCFLKEQLPRYGYD